MRFDISKITYIYRISEDIQCIFLNSSIWRRQLHQNLVLEYNPYKRNFSGAPFSTIYSPSDIPQASQGVKRYRTSVQSTAFAIEGASDVLAGS